MNDRYLRSGSYVLLTDDQGIIFRAKVLRPDAGRVVVEIKLSDGRLSKVSVPAKYLSPMSRS